VAGAVVVAAGVLGGLALAGNDTDQLRQAPPPVGGLTSTPDATGSATATAPPPVTTALTLPVGLPVWPFADGAAALAAKATATAGPAATALRFTTVHLRFTDDNKTFGTELSKDKQQAWVTVGYLNPDHRNSTAAVVHLARWSNSGPWEVVGTRDSTLSLTKPSYGATAASPIHVGGQIVGVDENIRVAVHQPSIDAPLGVSCCTAAGSVPNPGPWSASVKYTSSNAKVLTVVASTGGHVTQHERWAITAVRNPTASAAAATAPSTFVAVSQNRIGVFRTSDGTRVRWLTTPQPGGGDADPQVVGDQVYFQRIGSACVDSISRVPLAGGSEHAVYTPPSGVTLGGYDVSQNGTLAMVLVRCTDSAQRLYVLNPATGHSHSTAYSSGPPMIEGNLAWAPDNANLAVVVRTGTSGHVVVLDAFSVKSITSGAQPFGNPGGADLPLAVSYSGSTLLAVFFDGTRDIVRASGPGPAHQLFAVNSGSNRMDGFAADPSGNVILGIDNAAASSDDIVIRSSGQTRRLKLHGVGEPAW
jgi:hypothetical protein